ncbi:MAG TPA: flagellar hook-basal body complex protein FliE [Devosiaceae bacterium]|jgi:flagellar hook-basal body complex protein FliE
MSIPFTAAANAYNSAAKLVTQNGQALQMDAPMPASPSKGPDFGKLLSDSLQSVIDTGKSSEQKSMDLMNGKGDVVDVVTAISQTEMAVESMVAVRDRVVSAYEEIMRMPI